MTAVAVFLQKHVKYLESRLKAVKARNEYILCLEAANAAMQKYFNDDMHELINVCSLTCFLALYIAISLLLCLCCSMICVHIKILTNFVYCM